jgi:hypothetical protein
MGHVVLNVGGEIHGTQVPMSLDACDAIRFKFNPSGLHNVAKLKALAAAFISQCDEVAKEMPGSGRELSVAKTNMQTASMWAVLGATKGL